MVHGAARPMGTVSGVAINGARIVRLVIYNKFLSKGDKKDTKKKGKGAQTPDRSR
ncbi:hypothetical protein SAMD00023353_4400760 [Rosellinia necatrix]|uniref:Uncharacterized protein n=1 Tax=Rosellinia necatrix TaxID=77044 RepID=A0A1W2TNM5_ROSNE|nr:hypothetical protein SAMD00023353_4400760 [Rosellinia necatrix]